MVLWWLRTKPWGHGKPSWKPRCFWGYSDSTETYDKQRQGICCNWFLYIWLSFQITPRHVRLIRVLRIQCVTYSRIKDSTTHHYYETTHVTKISHTEVILNPLVPAITARQTLLVKSWTYLYKAHGTHALVYKYHVRIAGKVDKKHQ